MVRTGRGSSSASDDDDIFKGRLLRPWIAAAAPLVAIASLAWFFNPSAVSAAATAVYHSDASINPALLTFFKNTGTTLLVGFASSFVGWLPHRLLDGFTSG
jgi:hypothetical protein